MSKGKKPTILPPDTRLKEKLGPGRMLADLIDAHKLEMADHMISQNSAQFHEQLQEDFTAIQTTLAAMKQDQGSTPVHLAAVQDAAFRIKSIAGTFRFTLASQVATLLHQRLEGKTTVLPADLVMIETHLDSLRSIISHDIQGDGGTVGRELLRSLQALSAK